MHREQMGRVELTHRVGPAVVLADEVEISLQAKRSGGAQDDLIGGGHQSGQEEQWKHDVVELT